MVSFTPVSAQTLGNPDRILLLDAIDRDDRSVALIYTDPTYGGRYIVEESLYQTNQQELESTLGTCDPAEGCVGSSSIVTLNDSQRAVVMTGEGSNTIVWLEQGGNGLMSVYGPLDTFTAAYATTVANILEGAPNGPGP